MQLATCKGELFDLKRLILQENGNAFYIYCFAHQLQLTLEANEECHAHIIWYFKMIAVIIKCHWRFL